MTLDAQLADLLRARGQRATPQRLVILRVLAEHPTHLTAEALHAQVRRHYPSISLSTVYRTLETLRDHGIVSETDLGGGVHRFELLDRPHHHLICLTCGHQQEMAVAHVEPLRQRLLDHYGFQARLDHLAIFGYCRGCQAPPSPASSAC